jgi:hypothetical protein
MALPGRGRIVRAHRRAHADGAGRQRALLHRQSGAGRAGRVRSRDGDVPLRRSTRRRRDDRRVRVARRRPRLARRPGARTGSTSRPSSGHHCQRVRGRCWPTTLPPTRATISTAPRAAAVRLASRRARRSRCRTTTSPESRAASAGWAAACDAGSPMAGPAVVGRLRRQLPRDARSPAARGPGDDALSRTDAVVLPVRRALRRRGYTWTGGIYADRVARLNVETGEWNFYLLPFEANIRDIDLQPPTTGGTVGPVDRPHAPGADHAHRAACPLRARRAPQLLSSR